jgi:threonine dehydrogenase-like Zn-dependent dehydrogenase
MLISRSSQENSLLIGDNPVPEPALHEVTVRIVARSLSRRTIPGDGLSGVVVKSHDSKDAALVGKRAAILPYRHCGICLYCRTRREHLCVSAKPVEVAEESPDFVVIPSLNVYPIAEALHFAEAAMADTVSLAIAACGKAAPLLAEDSLVMGSAESAFVILQLLRILGARKVIYAGEAASHDLARRMGADEVLVPGEASFAADLAHLTGGEGVKSAFDTQGTAASHTSCLNALGGTGRLVSLCGGDTEIQYKLKDFSGERSATVVTGSRDANFRLALRLLEAGKIDVKPLITIV